MNGVEESISQETLIAILTERQIYSAAQLEAMSRHFTGKAGYGMFAPIKSESCAACRVKVATAILQRAREGLFITCSSCARLLYLPGSLFAVDGAGGTINQTINQTADLPRENAA